MRVRRAAALAIVIAGLSVSTAFAAGFDDDFNDGVMAPQWSAIIDSPATLLLNESSGRLNVIASSPPPNSDAIYLSNGSSGFRLSTTSDFDIRVDYSFLAATAPGAFNSAVVFGLGRDLDGTDSAAIGYARGATLIGSLPFAANGLVVAHRTDDVQTTDLFTLSNADTGTFVLQYHAAGDDLAFGRLGETPLFILNDTVRTVWGADDLYVSLGGRGQGATISSGNAWLDNFQIVSGVTVVPEPTTLAAASVALIALRRRG
ncbi:MAG: hypothetical protein QM770_07435 [Tepidisphaeraceae bacterium]